MKVGSVRKPLILSPHMQPNVGRGKLQKTVVGEPLGTKIANVVRYTITDPLVKVAEATKQSTKMAAQTVCYVANVTSDACRRSLSSTQKAASLVFPWLANTVFFSLKEKTVQVGRWTTNSILSPIAQSVSKTKNFVTALPQNTVSGVIQPSNALVGRLAVWTYNTLAAPVVGAVTKSAKAVFVTFPAFVRNDMGAMFAEQTRRVAKATNQNLISSITLAAQNIASLALLKLPKAINDRVIVPVAQGTIFAATTGAMAVAKAAQAVIFAPYFVATNVAMPALSAAQTGVKWSYNKTSSGLLATGQAIIAVPRAIVDTVVKPSANAALSGINWSCGKIVAASSQTAQTILSGPRLVINNALQPTTNAILSSVKWTYGQITDGTLKTAQAFSNTILSTSKVLNERLVSPVMTGVGQGTATLANALIRPVSQLIAKTGALVSGTPKAFSCLTTTVTTGPRVIHNAIIAPVVNKIASIAVAIFEACKYAIVSTTQYVTSTVSNTVMGAYSQVAKIPTSFRSFVPARWQQTKASV